jgi:hypothetical protein
MKNAMKALLVAAALASLGAVGLAASAIAQGGPPQRPQLPPADAQSTKFVEAANAFIATLTEDQKKTALFAFNNAKQRVNWSNFPNGAYPRAGVAWGDMNETQHAAAMAMLAQVLSAKGVALVQNQMAADDILKATAPPDPPNLPPALFGSHNYHVSFVGTPSTTAPWMLQFGGHHMALNVTVVGPNITMSPSLTGGQPLHFNKDGKAVYVVAEEAKAGLALLNSFTPAQRKRAVISDQRINLILGPGHDGQTLQPEGLPGSAMTEVQKKLLLSTIEARVGILNADDLAPKMEAIRKYVNETYFAWWGPAQEGEAYFRVTGPTVLLEFAPQPDGGSDHMHNIYRDSTNEYGIAWTPLTR